MNICACGAEAGYPHDWCCPYPLFGGTDAKYEQWIIDSQIKFESELPVSEVDAQAEAVTEEQE